VPPSINELTLSDWSVKSLEKMASARGTEKLLIVCAKLFATTKASWSFRQSHVYGPGWAATRLPCARKINAGALKRVEKRMFLGCD